MPHQDKSQKCYLDLGINLEWPYVAVAAMQVLLNKLKTINMF